MAKLSKRRNSTASVRQFLLDVIKPTPVLSSLGKRDRGNDVSEDDNTRVGEPPSASPLAVRSYRPACVALQNEDPAEDAVVITALSVIPFCCHADLVVMSRTQLLAVATTFNAKLPLAMQIDTTSSRSDAWIRHSIEVLVGIRAAMPESQAGPLTRSRTRDSAAALDRGSPATPCTARGPNVPASPMSPLASRGRPSMSFGTPSLAVLQEDSEEHHPEARPQKRRRIEHTLPFDPTRPITRAQGRRVSPLLAKAPDYVPKAIGAAAGARILRSRSTPNPPTASAQTRTPTRTPRQSARSRGSRVTKSHTLAMTSTPKKRVAAAVNSPRGTAPCTRSLLGEVQNLNMTARGYCGSSGLGKKGKAREVSADIEELTFGLDGLTMPMISLSTQYSDMELCSD